MNKTVRAILFGVNIMGTIFFLINLITGNTDGFTIAGFVVNLLGVLLNADLLFKKE